MPDNTILAVGSSVHTRTPALNMQKWGGLAFFVLAVAFIVPRLIYFTGNLQDPGGPLVYNLADVLYGPLWAASLVTAVFALREHIGQRAQQRMNLALLAALLAAGVMVSVAFIRSANRQYHLAHPELNLEMSTTVLVVWSTIIAGLIATAWHFTGWTFVLLGWAGWTTRRLPRLLSGLCLVIGVLSLFAHLLLNADTEIAPLSMVASLWLGILLWRGGRG